MYSIQKNNDSVGIMGAHVNTQIKCVFNQLHNLVFMKAKLLKIQT
jgi:hypothetical protein